MRLRLAGIAYLYRKHVHGYSIVLKRREHKTGMHELCKVKIGVANGLDRTANRTSSKQQRMSRTTILEVRATRL